MIVYRTLHTPAEMDAVVDLEMTVWGMEARDAVPETLLIALANHGGHVLGAYEDDTLIGFSAAFFGHDEGLWQLWSHMAAVHPRYQSQGIGFQIKQEQRTWALAHGCTRMGWTFDPLQPGNAKFNLRQLGVIARHYSPNCYGLMRDALNSTAITLPSDRLVATWLLDSPYVQALAENQLPRPSALGPFVVERDDNDDQPVSHPVAWDEPAYCIELPLHSSILRRTNPALLLLWQTRIREAMQEAFAHGYMATNFLIENGRGWYIVETNAALLLS